MGCTLFAFMGFMAAMCFLWALSGWSDAAGVRGIGECVWLGAEVITTMFGVRPVCRYFSFSERSDKSCGQSNKHCGPCRVGVFR